MHHDQVPDLNVPVTFILSEQSGMAAPFHSHTSKVASGKGLDPFVVSNVCDDRLRQMSLVDWRESGSLKYLMTVIAGKVGGSEEILRMGRNLSHIAMVGRN